MLVSRYPQLSSSQNEAFFTKAPQLCRGLSASSSPPLPSQSTPLAAQTTPSTTRHHLMNLLVAEEVLRGVEETRETSGAGGVSEYHSHFLC
ncbi:hypothetical protein RchiOBHm_Chr6g0251351 [Rosa chinensis]|uniref:Uncharacterized protein n=1 Tax=Rosa chinensis TaxID=74649 RepID=A0A2P6PKT0_ROSCH|nr:hypothetical protein RchiOBHm_Chr6g0251351 [Rosa chinensis]